VNFISMAMKKPAVRHDRLLQLVKEIAENAPLTALRLLHVSGVNIFGHVISIVPPAIIRPFAEARDAAGATCLEEIQDHEVGVHSTHDLPVGARVASLHSLVRHGGKPPRYVLPHCWPSHRPPPHDVRKNATEGSGATLGPGGGGGRWGLGGSPSRFPQSS
jgi:hypothetical protein